MDDFAAVSDLARNIRNRESLRVVEAAAVAAHRELEETVAMYARSRRGIG